MDTTETAGDSSSIRKYPRTPHIAGSRLQPGDEDMDQAPLSELFGLRVVVEEKVDGANCGISFGPSGELLLQSRGHYLRGGPRERQFNLLKTWASGLETALFEALEDRYIVYGEWLYAKHTVFYDALPHYFLEFDVFDRQTQRFLSTSARKDVLKGLPIHSVPVLYDGLIKTPAQLQSFIRPSLFKTLGHRQRLVEVAKAQHFDPERALAETEASLLAEGLYLKVESDAEVTGRYKFVRFDFLNTIQTSGSHWFERPILPNQLAEGASLWS
jgi:hypothetical protein